MGLLFYKLSTHHYNSKIICQITAKPFIVVRGDLIVVADIIVVARDVSSDRLALVVVVEANDAAKVRLAMVVDGSVVANVVVRDGLVWVVGLLDDSAVTVGFGVVVSLVFGVVAVESIS